MSLGPGPEIGQPGCESAESYFALGFKCEATGQLEQAERNYARAIAVDPLLAKAHLHHALVAHKSGSTAIAINRLREARDLLGPTLDLDWHLAMLHEGMGQGTIAEKYYRAVLTELPDHGPSLLSLGCLRRDAGCFDESELHLRRAEDAMPERADASWQLGITLEMRGVVSAAERAYRRALAKADEPRYHSALASFLRSRNRLPEALVHFERAADFIFENFEAQRSSVKHVGSIVAAFMPKSGGTYLANAIRRGTGLIETYFGVFSFLDYSDFYVIENLLRRFLEGGCFSHNHMSATPRNVQLLKSCSVPRVWVHVRDPRQAILSSFHHHAGEGQGNGPIAVRRRLEIQQQNRLVEDAMGDELNNLDAFVEKLYPWLVKWIADWKTVNDSGELPVVFTTFENLRRCPTSFFADVWREFLPPDMVPCESVTVQPDDRFRQGLVDEWKTVLNPRQRSRLMELTPSWMYDRFGWVP